MVRIFFILCCLSGPLWAAGNPEHDAVIHLQGLQEGVFLGKSLSYLEDPGMKLSFADIVEQADRLEFRRGQQDVVNLGFSKSAVWVRLLIDNASADTQNIYLEFAYPVIDHLSIHALDSQGHWQEKRAGDAELQSTTDVPENRSPSFLLELQPGLSTVYVQIHGDGSMQIPIKLWTRNLLEKSMLVEYTGLAFLYGIFLVMILYNFLLCLWFRSLAYLIYVVFIVCSTLNFMNLQGFSLVLFPREIGIFLSNKLAFFANLSVVLCMSFGHQFLGLSALRKLDRLYKTVIAVASLATVISLFSYNIGIKLFVLLTFITSFILISGGIYRSMQGFRPAYFFTLSWTCILVGHILLQLSFLGILPISFLTSFGAFIGSAMEVVLLSLAMGDKMRFAQQMARKEISSLNQHLEQLVEDKTRNIRSILKNIRQGVFMMGPDRQIMADSSEFLQEIFEESSLAGRNAFELLFARSSVSSDLVNQSESVITAAFLEPAIAFELNEHLLCREVVWSNHQGAERILEYDWNPMIKDGVIDKILVTVRDMTEHKVLEKKNRENEAELKILGEIVNVEAATFRKFISQSQRQLATCQSLCKGLTSPDTLALRQIQVELHTLKGAARSFHFSDLANEVHELEQSLQSDLGPRLAHLEQTLERYVHVAEAKLGRSPSARQRIEFDRQDVTNRLNRLDEVCRRKTVSLRELLDQLSEQRSFLYQHIHTDLAQVWESMRGVLASAAKDLGKLTPELLVDSVHDVWVTAEGEDLLSNVFIHILRNAVDHGLESTEERIKLGKTPNGHVKVKVGLDRKGLLLEVTDDGAGINLALIRQKAEKQGLLQPLAELSETALADLIFVPGFSTRDQASLISGRGVGMDAVKAYLLEKGGEISLELLPRPHPLMGSRYFSLNISLPATLFQVLEPVQVAIAS